MQDRARRWKSIGLGMALAASLVAGAGAGLLDVDLYIVAPSSVLAGWPINGYAYSLNGLGVITGTSSAGQPLGPPVVSVGGLLTHYSYPTVEPMAGTCVTIRARDDVESAQVSVIVQ